MKREMQRQQEISNDTGPPDYRDNFKPDSETIGDIIDRFNKELNDLKDSEDYGLDESPAMCPG